jgi:hypothetical protein
MKYFRERHNDILDHWIYREFGGIVRFIKKSCLFLKTGYNKYAYKNVSFNLCKYAKENLRKF